MSDLLSGLPLLSGRVKKTPPNQVSADRYDWITLQEAEPDLGLPNVSGAVLLSADDGTRSWSSNLTVDGTGNLEAGEITTTKITANGQIISTLPDTAPLVITSNVLVENLNADLLDGFHADKDNVENTVLVRDSDKNISFSNAIMSGATSGTTTLQPSLVASGTLTLPAATDTLVARDTVDTLTNKTLITPIITGVSPTITLTGDVTGSGTLTDLGSVSFSTTITANSVELGTDTTGNYIATVAGTTNQVVVTGSGVETAAITLSLPQDIHIGATPTFNGMTLTEELSMSSYRITNLATPTQNSDAATKAYADEIAQGLQVRRAADILIDINLSATYDNGEDNDGIGSTLTALVDGAFPEFDDVLLTDPESRVLVIGQTNKAENGLYVLDEVGDNDNPWVLRRCQDCDESSEVAGTFVFIESGTQYAATGWVAVVGDPSTYVIGTDPIEFIQFSGAGIVQAGTGLSSDGNILSVNASLPHVTGLGTINSGTWNGDVISPIYGGTGVNNGSSTITLGGSFTHTGAHSLSVTTTDNTSITLPTSGTLAVINTGLGQFAATSSAELAGVISDETGTGALVFANSPTITTGILTGSASFDVFNTVATAINAFGDATDIALGATTGTITIRNAATVISGDLEVNGGDITTSTTGIATVFNANATTLHIGSAATAVTLGHDTGTTTINNNLVVSGNLTINGTTTALNTVTLQIEDKNIEIANVDVPTDITADGAGITVKGATDKTFNWVNASDSWTSSEHLDLATSKDYKINGSSVLSNTTLGSGVVNSSLTSVGTIVSGIWDATAIAIAHGGTGATTAPQAITNLGATTVGGNLFTLPNPSAVTFLRVNADNTVSTVTAEQLRLAIGASSADFIKKTSAYTAVAGDLIIADTGAGSFVITLPATPATGATVTIADGHDWGTYSLTVARNGSTIEGNADDVLFDIKGAYVVLVYDGSTWETFVSYPSAASITNDTTTNSSFYVPFLDASSGNLVNVKVTTTKLYFNPSSGALSATDFNSLSDIRFKDNINEIVNGLSIVNNLRPVEFTWKETNKKAFGVIAQEIEQTLPEIVSTNDVGIKTVSYDQIIPFLISAIKELQEEIKILRNK
jgi:hypothetical protein